MRRAFRRTAAVLQCAALVDLNNIHTYLLLLRYQDPFNAAVFGMQPQGATLERSLICALQTRDWYVINQGMDLISIVSLPLAETNELVLYGSSGPDITQLLINDNAPVTFILKTALSAHGNIIINKQAIKAGIALTASIPQSMTFLVESENQVNSYTLKASRPIVWRNANNEIITFTVPDISNVQQPMSFMVGPAFSVPYLSVDGYGHVLGATLFSTTSNMSINAVLFEYVDADLWSEFTAAG